MVQHYDYTFASVLSASMHVNGKEGPVLVALKEPYDPVREFGSRDSLSEHPDALLLDLSSFGDDDLAQAMLIWKERLTSDPSEWQQGLPLLVFKMNLRNFLEKYGSAIMGLLNVKSNVGGQEDLFRHSFLASAH
jgi:hypothetical protein